jgi:protein SCO1/2
MARILAMLLAVLTLLAGCSRPVHFNSTDITGVEWGRDFRLVDHTGKPRQLSDFKGKVVALFFGYTQCPDVCPTTLSTMAQAMKMLGSSADNVQVLFITLDPERDTRDVLTRYVPAFNPTFLGLSGDAVATRRTADAFKVFYQKQPGTTPSSYTLDHTSATYLFDPQGRLRLYGAYGMPADQLAADMRILLAGK